MHLSELVDGIAHDFNDVEVNSLCYDSRTVKPGALFFCVSGFEVDGHDFARQAVTSGAVALVVERPLGIGVPEIVVSSVRAEMAKVASRFYGVPSKEMKLVGITGTNGKTTTTFLVRSILQAVGMPCGLLGTVKAVVGGQERDAVRTTQEAVELQADLRTMVDSGELACTMEVSSHALELHRCDGCEFSAVAFTNLTQDHLDYHGDMESYFQAKRLLFAMAPQQGVINLDDPYGRRLMEEFPDSLGFGIEQQAQMQAVDLQIDFSGSSFTLQYGGNSYPVSVPLPGRFNVANALTALALAVRVGVDIEAAILALQRPEPVPGRFEPISEGQEFAVIVDYAHTPDSLKNVLQAARELTTGRVISVFGCGGDRDRGKRPLMGEISAELADLTVVTSDNPRSEQPQAIIEQITAGIPSGANVQVEADRRLAIELAISQAGSGDVVIIAGKGHEQGQEFADGRKLPFDDREVTAEVLKALHAES